MQGSDPARSLLTGLGGTLRPERRGPDFMYHQAPVFRGTLVEPMVDSVPISMPAASVVLCSYYQVQNHDPRTDDFTKTEVNLKLYAVYSAYK